MVPRSEPFIPPLSLAKHHRRSVRNRACNNESIDNRYQQTHHVQVIPALKELCTAPDLTLTYHTTTMPPYSTSNMPSRRLKTHPVLCNLHTPDLRGTTARRHNSGMNPTDWVAKQTPSSRTYSQPPTSISYSHIYMSPFHPPKPPSPPQTTSIQYTAGIGVYG